MVSAVRGLSGATEGRLTRLPQQGDVCAKSWRIPEEYVEGNQVSKGKVE